MHVVRALASALAFCALAGCADNAYKPLDALAQGQVTASVGLVGVGQPGLDVDTNPIDADTVATVAGISSAAVVGYNDKNFARGFRAGFIVSLASDLVATSINETELKTAEHRLAPLNKELAGFDFDGPAFSTMQAQLSTVSWLHLGQVSLTKQAKIEDYDKALHAAEAPYVLIVNMNYFMSYDFKQLYVTAHIQLFPKPLPGDVYRHDANGGIHFVPASDPDNAAYADTVAYVASVPKLEYQRLKDQLDAAPLPGNPGEADIAALADAQYWSRDHAAPLKKAFMDATQELGRLAAGCLRNPGKPGSMRDKDEVAFGTMEGRLLDGGADGRVLIQFDDGSLMSTEADLIKLLQPGKHQ